MLFDEDDDLRAPALNAAVGVVAWKEIDQTVSNRTVLVADESIVWDVLAGAIYVVRANVAYMSEDVPDIRIGWTHPADAAMAWHGTGYSSGSVYQNFANADPSAGATSFGGSGDGSARVARASGTLVMGDTDGELRLAWAQFVANAANTSVLAGSFGVLQRIA